MKALLRIVPALALVPVLAAEPSVEERLRALEQTVQQLAKENGELRKQLGWKESAPPVLVRPAGSATRVSVGGFLQGQADFGGAPDPRWSAVNDRLYFRRARVFVAGQFAEHVEFKAELDLQGNTLGASTGNLARANEIFVGWTRHPAANLRFGQLKPAFGAEQLQSDTRTVFIERTYGSDRLTDGRNLALGLSGAAPGGRWTYAATLANGNGSNVSANDNDRFQTAARVGFVPWTGPAGTLTLGVAGLRTTDQGVNKPGLGLPGNSFTGRRSLWGVDATLKTKPFELQAEVLGGTWRPVVAVPAREFEPLAWHALAAWNAVPGKLQLALRREEFDPRGAPGVAELGVWSLGLNWLIRGDDLKLQVNWLEGDDPAAGSDAGRLLTRMQVVF